MSTTIERSTQPKMTPAQYELFRYAAEKLGWTFRNMILFLRLYSNYPFNDVTDSPENLPTQKEVGAVLSYLIHRIKYNQDTAKAMAVRLERNAPEIVDPFILYWQEKTGISTVHWGATNNNLVPEEEFPLLVLTSGDDLKTLYRRFVDSFHSKGQDDWSAEEDYALIEQVAHIRKIKLDDFQCISRMREMKPKHRTAQQLKIRWNKVLRSAYFTFLEKLQPIMSIEDPEREETNHHDESNPVRPEEEQTTKSPERLSSEPNLPTTDLAGAIKTTQVLLEQLRGVKVYDEAYVRELESKLSIAQKDNERLVAENERLTADNADLMQRNQEIDQQLSSIQAILNPKIA